MILMVTDDENKNKNYDELSELLRKFYKPAKEIKENEFWNKVSKTIDSLFHKEILSDSFFDKNGLPLSEESRYWLGLEQYLKNEVPSLKHKIVTDHLLSCKECRKNYNQALDKKKDDLVFAGITCTV